MDHALKPAQTNLEVADATPPMRVNLLTQACDLHSHALRGGVEQSQRGNEVEPFQGGCAA